VIQIPGLPPACRRRRIALRRAGVRADGDSAAATSPRSSQALRRLQHDHRARESRPPRTCCHLSGVAPFAGIAAILARTGLAEIRSASYTRSVDMPTPPPTTRAERPEGALAERPSTVREVHEELYRNTEVGYTTTAELLQNMFAKGLVKRTTNNASTFTRPPFRSGERSIGWCGVGSTTPSRVRRPPWRCARLTEARHAPRNSPLSKR